MTRIKKRRSGKKRTKDRKKVSAGRRGARAAKKDIIAKEKKEQSPLASTVAGKKDDGAPKKTGKTRSAGARRVAVAKSIAKNSKTNKQVAKPKKEADGEERPAKKGFAPWNKNKRRKKPE